MLFGFKDLTYRDWLSATALFLGSMLVFASGANLLGFYYDDGGFLVQLTTIKNPSELWYQISNYVPGRNLHVLWQYLIFALVGDPARHLPALHFIQSALDAGVVVTFYVLMRRLGLSAAPCAMAAALFAFWPIHGETHFWISALPMNIVSTFFVLVFALTSLSLASETKQRAWVWAVDVASFWCAILTYDQTFVVLLLILGTRIGWSLVHRKPDRRVFLSFHLLHIFGVAFFLWLRLHAAGTTLVPFQRADTWKISVNNAIFTVLMNGGHLGRDYARMLAQKATGGDRLLAWIMGGLAVVFSIWLMRDRPLSLSYRKRLNLLVLASLFWVAAYLPIWLWNPGARHHYLPTVGSLCAVAVLLDWLQSAIRFRAVSAMAYLGLGVVVVGSVLADRGESHYWEEAFISKKRLLLEIRPKLEGKIGLVLEDFPISDGPAMFITPHDAVFGLSILMPDLSLPADFRGALKATRDPDGIALDPNSTVPAPAPKDLPVGEVLWLRCESFEKGVLRYSVISAP